MAFIKVENLKYKYPHSKELALKNISFEIERGEFIGIIGENNSGKSTLCQSFIGLVPNFYKGAYGGKVIIDELEVAKSDISKLCSKVGIVFQNPFNQLTGAKDNVYEEVAFGLQNLGLSRSEIHTRVEEALKLLDIESFKSRNPFDLSGGQMQRVAIASILAMKPEIIVLDEPTSQLDPQGSEEVFRAVNKLTESGITVIMVEHKIEKIAEYSDKVMLLHKGELISFDKPEKVFSMDNLKEYGINAPIFTRICSELGIRDKETNLYPTTLDKTKKVLLNLRKFNSFNKIIEATTESIIENRDDIIKVNNLEFSYEADKGILCGINFNLDKRTTAIIGQNGSGKTTLVKLLKGLLKPISGSIYYKGENISTKTVSMLASNIGLVFQNPNDQIFKNKVIDEVMFGPLNIGMSHELAKEKSIKALDMVGLRNVIDENPYDLGLSERKLLAIASVIAMDTAVIILDEPTIAQDYRGKEVIKKIIKKLKDLGKLVITIIHDMDFVAEAFERTIVISKGNILLDDSTKNVFSHEDILKEAHLDVPNVTKLCKKLGYKDIYLTVEDFIKDIKV